MQTLLNKIFNKIKILYNYIRIELNLNFNIPYDFLLKEPIATEEEYISIHNKIKNLSYESIDYFENKLGYSINKEWLNNLALHTQVVIKKSSINYQHGRVLYSCLRDYLRNHNNIQILETGTAKGFSSICMSKALKDSQKDGEIFTIDIIPHDKAMYWNGISDSYGKISRKNLLKPWADYTQNINFLHGRTNKIINHIIKKNFLKRINFAFLDAAHNLSAVRKEFYFVSDKQFKGDIIVFDDVTKNQFDEVYNFVKSLDQKKIYKIEYINSSPQRAYAIAQKI